MTRSQIRVMVDELAENLRQHVFKHPGQQGLHPGRGGWSGKAMLPQRSGPLRDDLPIAQQQIRLFLGSDKKDSESALFGLTELLVKVNGLSRMFGKQGALALRYIAFQAEKNPRSRGHRSVVFVESNRIQHFPHENC
jgi:hypothetical protein